ncbi:hypothetical protein [Variovorax paradoxus]|uniref:hypothetical protein n=1 Tax=Variovorax paradoxus TaxID=34073 RepID=UPI00277ECFDD|nr:hypothetical protein [Variovorax paradoxus]MDQ0587904.1 hypothetical protein [Variovorax paradoxus]
MNNYPQYKPLRNLLRQYNLQGSIEDIWWYFQAVDLPSSNEKVWTGQGFTKLKEVLHKWEIAILAREIVLNATPEGELRLRPWLGMARVLNMLRRVDNDMAGAHMTPERAYNSLTPTGQLQFPWQRPRQFNALMRYFKVFSESDVERLLVRETGVSTKEWFFVGFGAAGLLQHECGISAHQDYRPFGIELERSKTVFDKLSQPFEELRAKVNDAARYDDTWMYTWNPLEAKPLVGLDPTHPERLHCPIPYYVLKRASQGLFYEIAQAEGFNNPFGASFQAYLGEVLGVTFPSPQFTIYEEREYKVGRNRKDGVDWILTDDRANLFIECKAKRMNVGAKSAVDSAIISQQVDYLAKAVIQLYKNIADALAGHTHWPRNDRPIFPLVVTLEDWYLFGTSADLLAEGVRTKMAEANLDLRWLDTMPYTVASCEDFEDVSPTIAEVGIHAFFSLKHSGDQQRWMIQHFAKEHFIEVYRRTVHRDLFREEWDQILPENVLPFRLKNTESRSS